jgi:hypothetical protein
MSWSAEINDQHAFDPETVAAMATALEQVCDALRISGDAVAREVIATRIIELARRGENDAEKLRDSQLFDTSVVETLAQAEIQACPLLARAMAKRHIKGARRYLYSRTSTPPAGYSPISPAPTISRSRI